MLRTTAGFVHQLLCPVGQGANCLTLHGLAGSAPSVGAGQNRDGQNQLGMLYGCIEGLLLVSYTL